MLTVMTMSIALRGQVIQSLACLVLALLPACGLSPQSEADEAASGPETLFWAEFPELRARVIDGTGRLARATGRDDIAVERGGVPVTMVHDLEDFGRPVCARTLRNGHNDAIGIELHANPPSGYCRDLTSEFIHEAMHAMAPEADHADSGIFAPAANPTVWIDDVSLATFCGSFECAAFTPEAH
jgi:hypothetical protein